MYSSTQLLYLLVLFLVTSFSIFLCVKKERKGQEYLYIYLSLTLALEFLMYIFQILFKSSSDFEILYNAYFLFCAIFFLKYFNRGQERGLVRLNSIIFCIFCILYVLFVVENYWEINQGVAIIFALTYILYGLIWFYGKLMNPNLIKIWNEPKFWISSAFLFWGVFFILRVIPRYLFDRIDNEVLIVSQSLFFIINIIFYLFFLVSLVKYDKKNGG
jgi:hypothetical protein